MGLFGSKEITGIDIGAGSIKVVRLKPAGRSPRLVSAGILELPLEPGPMSTLAADLKHLQFNKKIGKKNIVTMISGRHLTIRSFALPKMPQAELREAVRWESKRHISYPLESALVEHLIAGEKREGVVDKYDILMVAAERGMVMEQLLPFREAQIKITAVDANPLALRNLLRFRGKTGGGNVLVVDMGAGKAEINVFKTGSLRFSRCLETGGLDVTREISAGLGVTLQDAEAAKKKVDVLSSSSEHDKVFSIVKARLDTLLLEVRRSIEYYKTTFREPGVEHTILTGGGALAHVIKDYFSMQIDGNIEIDEPFSPMSFKKKAIGEFGGISPRFSTAVGLALRKF